MAKIYYVQHQAHGVAHEFPFAEHPTQNQVALVAKHCFALHGFGHPKTPDQPYWTRVIDVELLGPDDAPAIREPGPVGVSEPGVGKVVSPGPTVSGFGHITEQ